MKKDLRKRRVSRWPLPGALIMISYCLACLGCAPPREVYVSYTLPPRQAIELKGGTAFQLAETELALRGDDASRAEAAVFRTYLKDRFAALIYRENAHQVVDDFCATPEGSDNLQKRVTLHQGISHLHCPPFEPVMVHLEGTVTIERERGIDHIQTELFTSHYQEVIQTKKDGTQKVEIKNLKTTSRPHVDSIPFETLTATGYLRCTLKTGDGRVLYQKAFQNLHFSAKAGGSSAPGALPTSTETAARLFNGPLVALVKDISPHTEHRKLVVNEKGDPLSVALMKATAFSEAMTRLDLVILEREEGIAEIAKQRKEELQGKIQEIHGSSKPPEAKAADVEKAQKAVEEDLRKARSPLSPDYHNYAIGFEVDGDWGNALTYYQKAWEADPANADAKASFDRLNAEIDKIKRQQREAQNPS